MGVVNRGEVRPEGFLFGPYTDNFIPVAKYEEIKKAETRINSSSVRWMAVPRVLLLLVACPSIIKLFMREFITNVHSVGRGLHSSLK